MYRPIDTYDLDDPEDGVTIKMLNFLICEVNARLRALADALEDPLPPCPYCGSVCAETPNYRDTGRYAIACKRDDCLTVVQDTRERAREAWLQLHSWG